MYIFEINPLSVASFTIIFFFSLHMFVFFYSIFFLFIANLLMLWLEKMLDNISILLNLPRLALWSSLWSILENVACAPEKKVHSIAFGRKAL